MKITSIKTPILSPKDKALPELIDFVFSNLPKVKEKSVLIITSKIISILQGQFKPVNGTDKEQLIYDQADWLAYSEHSKHKKTITIKDHILVSSAGIDESNADGYYILWPKQPQQTANLIREELKKRLKIKDLGIIISDTRSMLLRRGTIGVSIAYSGLSWKKSYINKPDLFNKPYNFTEANIVDALAIAGVMEMGEGKEQTPLALIEDIKNIQFKKSNPTKEELKEFKFNFKEDIYYDLIANLNWQKKK